MFKVRTQSPHKSAKPRMYRFKDEVMFDSSIGKRVVVRQILDMPYELRNSLSLIERLISVAKDFEGSHYSFNANIVERIEEFVDLYSVRTTRDIIYKLNEKFSEIQLNLFRIMNSFEVKMFLREITNGRYPSFFTLNHSGTALPSDVIYGGIFVSTFINPFWNGLDHLYVFGPKSSGFRKYLERIWQEVLRREDDKTIAGLRLILSYKDVLNYIENNDTAFITVCNCKEGHSVFDCSKSFLKPNHPIGISRINGVFGHVGSFKMESVDMHLFKYPNDYLFKDYRGKDNIEIIPLIYSSIPFHGLGEWGGRIEVSPNEITPNLYVDFKDTLMFADLAELVVDLRKGVVIFFDVPLSNV